MFKQCKIYFFPKYFQPTIQGKMNFFCEYLFISFIYVIKQRLQVEVIEKYIEVNGGRVYGQALLQMAVLITGYNVKNRK